jgi:hypothetical protein
MSRAGWPGGASRAISNPRAWRLPLPGQTERKSWEKEMGNILKAGKTKTGLKKGGT